MYAKRQWAIGTVVKMDLKVPFQFIPPEHVKDEGQIMAREHVICRLIPARYA
jgi:hypothetical protein